MGEHTGIERRSSERKRVYWGGEIVLNDYFESLGCVLRDVSEHGARVHLEANFKLPERFRVRVANRKLEAQARIAWRDGAAAGLAFDNLADAAPRAPSDKPDIPRAALRRQ